jgi:hypothetical protein
MKQLSLLKLQGQEKATKNKKAFAKKTDRIYKERIDLSPSASGGGQGEPNWILIIPIPVIIDQQFLPCLNGSYCFNGDDLFSVIHFILAIGTVGMIIQRHITQGHTALFPVLAPFKNIVVQQGLIQKTPVLSTHHNHGGNFNNGLCFQWFPGKNAPAPAAGFIYINSIRNKIYSFHTARLSTKYFP